MILTTDDIKTIVTDYFKDKPVRKVWLFGSYARGEADENCDLDVLVDLDRSAYVGLQFFGWNEILRQIVNKKVDVTSFDAVNKRLLPYIQRDMTLIYER
jgi:predicted nucleotidyltransferase